MKNLALLAISVLIVLGFAEAGLRLADFNQSYWFAARYAYATPEAFTMAASGVPSRPANAHIRHVALYAIGAPEVEYDYVLQTNNLGLAQDGELACGRPTTAVLGDSFTEGQGAPAWFPKVEAAIRTPDRQLANLGYLGTGMLNWRAMLAYHSACLSVDRLVFIFISHDWFRPIFEISPSQIDCLAGTGSCREPEHLWYPLGPGDSHEDLRERTASRKELRWANRSSWRDRLAQWELWPKRHSYLFALVRNAVVSQFGLGGMESRTDTPEVFTRSQSAFLEILATVGPSNVGLVMIPQADETVANTSNPQTLAVSEWLASQGLTADRCKLESSDYLPVDRHPNAQGYAKIAACVVGALEKLDTR